MQLPARRTVLLLAVCASCFSALLLLRSATTQYGWTSNSRRQELSETTLKSSAGSLFSDDGNEESDLRYQEHRFRLEAAARSVAGVDLRDRRDLSRLLLSDLHALLQMDGREERRSQLAKEAAAEVQRRLRTLQNPEQCGRARRLLCPSMNKCGFGCTIHHYSYCLIVAYATGRTLVLSEKTLRYGKAQWDSVFLPLSDTCANFKETKVANYPGSNDTLVLRLPTTRVFLAHTEFHPPAVPADLLPALKSFHGMPHAWWVGQMLSYLLRPQPATTKLLEAATQRLNYTKPIVGIHIRRGDKLIREAKYHSVDEYMAAVEDYYETLGPAERGGARKVYVASDDVSVFSEINKKYPHYTVIGDQNTSMKAGGEQRYDRQALNGLLVDIHLLSMSDYLVCTFSSNICRLAYELMQTLHTDASMRATSLDYSYGFIGVHTLRLYKAIIPHKARKPDEINLKAGDLISLKYYNRTISKGCNMNSSKTGNFPSFKVRQEAKSVVFPFHP